MTENTTTASLPAGGLDRAWLTAMATNPASVLQHIKEQSLQIERLYALLDRVSGLCAHHTDQVTHWSGCEREHPLCKIGLLCEEELRNAPSEPTVRDARQEWAVRHRAEGRLECLHILLGQSAELFPEKYTGTHAIADSGDYGMHWNHAELRKLFLVDEADRSLIEDLEMSCLCLESDVKRLKELLAERSLSWADRLRRALDWLSYRLTGTSLQARWFRRKLATLR